MNRTACGRNVLTINQREIILIPFPFSDLSGAKVRPALVVSNNKYNSQGLDIIVIAITSNLSPDPYKVFLDRKDLDSGLLPVKSAIRVDKPFSFLQGKVLKTLGTITTQKFEEVIISFQKNPEVNGKRPEEPDLKDRAFNIQLFENIPAIRGQ